MSIFKETTQIISELAIKENGVTIPKTTSPTVLNDIRLFLESIPSLTDADIYHGVELIPVKECREANSKYKYIIEMEDISRYMMTNNINNLKEAFSNILEHNGISNYFHQTAIAIDEASILGEISALGIDISKPANTTVGLGKCLLGDNLDLDKFRRFANSKEMLDQITNRYGIAVVKKKYPIGMINKPLGESTVNEENETTKMDFPKNAEVLQEKQPKKKDCCDKNFMDEFMDNIVDDEEDNIIDTVANESSDSVLEPMDERSKRIQYMREVFNGLHDDE